MKNILAMAFLVFPTITFADVPLIINFQGRFSSTGTITVDFRIDDSSPAAAPYLWEQTNVSFTGAGTRYLQVDPTTPDTDPQHIELVSVPFAYRAFYADQLAGGTTVQGSLNVNGRIKDQTGNLDPVGTISLYGGSSAPAGWLLCDGSAVSRSTYAELFSVILTTFGAGNGSTTFNLPDLRQRFPMGKAASGTGSTLGGTGGAIDHAHTITSQGGLSLNTTNIDSNNQGAVGFGGDGKLVTLGGSGSTYGQPSNLTNPHNHDGATGSNNPPFVVVNYIIKY
jgi:microcystin-dependent protein